MDKRRQIAESFKSVLRYLIALSFCTLAGFLIGLGLKSCTVNEKKVAPEGWVISNPDPEF